MPCVCECMLKVPGGSAPPRVPRRDEEVSPRPARILEPVSWAHCSRELSLSLLPHCRHPEHTENPWGAGFPVVVVPTASHSLGLLEYFHVFPYRSVKGSPRGVLRELGG